MNSAYLFKRYIFILLSLAIGLSQAEAVDLSKPIKEIRVEGNQRSNKDTIRFYIHSKAGEKYSVKTTREDIRRIYELGYFDDIRLEIEDEAEGPVLIYRVEEKPFVKSVKLEGAKAFPEQDLVLIFKLKKGTFFQKHLIKKDVETLKRKYRINGYYLTEVEPRIKDAGNNKVDVVYHVFEKHIIKITNIEFIGNSFFKNYQLGDVMETGSVGFLPVSDSGNYRRAILRTDLLKLETMYRDAGFIKIRIEKPKVEIDKQSGIINITFVIHEGKRYFVGFVTAKGDNIHSADEILGKVKLRKGDPFNNSLFRSNLFDVTEMYANHGYAYASAIPSIKENDETKIVNIDIHVEPGPKVYIGRITIIGNKKSNENVIRREFRLHEGEAFSSKKVRRSRQRLIRLGYFDELNIDQKSGEKDDLLDMEVSVLEKNTGNISFGVGFSSAEETTFQAEIAESNLFGTGKKLAFGMDTSSLRNDYYIDLTDPRFMDKELLLGFKLYTREFDFTSYTRRAKGVGIRVGRSIGEFTSMQLGYTFEGVKVVIDDLPNSTEFLQSQEGTRLTSSISPSITKDTIDNFLNPTTGYRLSASSLIAGGPLGGDLSFYKVSLNARRYYPLPLNFVFLAKAEMKYATGYNDSELPIFEHYFMGGVTTLRGFSFNDVGPIDSNGDALGGDSSLLFNLEIDYIFSKRMRGLMFYDRGQVYGDKGDLTKTSSNRYNPVDMRHSVGFGMQFMTPMAPISLVWGFKLDPKEGEPITEFHFRLGGTF